MTASEFIQWVEEYYGGYRKAVRSAVHQFLSNFDCFFISALRVEVIKGFSTKWRVPPDVAVLREYINQKTRDRGRELKAKAHPLCQEPEGEQPKNMSKELLQLFAQYAKTQASTTI